MRLSAFADGRERSVCAHCSFIDYKNSKVVVGSVAVREDKILLCRRAIEPRKGFWTLPAGFLELGESFEEGPPAKPSRKPAPSSKSTGFSRFIR